MLSIPEYLEPVTMAGNRCLADRIDIKNDSQESSLGYAVDPINQINPDTVAHCVCSEEVML